MEDKPKDERSKERQHACALAQRWRDDLNEEWRAED